MKVIRPRYKLGASIIQSPQGLGRALDGGNTN